MVNVRSRSSTRCKATTRVKFFQGSGSSPREARRGAQKNFSRSSSLELSGSGDIVDVSSSAMGQMVASDLAPSVSTTSGTLPVTAPGRERADHLRQRAARPLESLDDAPLLRALDPEQGTALGGSPRSRQRGRRYGCGGRFRSDLEPDLEPNGPKMPNRALRRSRSAR